MTVRLECPHCGGTVRIQVAAVADDQARTAELVELVSRIVAERGPISGRAIRSTVRRRRADVHAALLALEAAGRIRHDGAGWVAC